MTLLVPNGSEVIILGNFLNATAPEDLVVKLYSSNTTPGETDIAATYTEATGGDYAEIPLTASSWVLTAGAPSQAEYPEITFTFTGTVGSVYGYYITQAISGNLLWSERFTNGPFNIQNNGDAIRITPRNTLE
jgi:hypothetical protein